MCAPVGVLVHTLPGLGVLPLLPECAALLRGLGVLGMRLNLVGGERIDLHPPGPAHRPDPRAKAARGGAAHAAPCAGSVGDGLQALLERMRPHNLVVDVFLRGAAFLLHGILLKLRPLGADTLFGAAHLGVLRGDRCAVGFILDLLGARFKPLYLLQQLDVEVLERILPLLPRRGLLNRRGVRAQAGGDSFVGVVTEMRGSRASAPCRKRGRRAGGRRAEGGESVLGVGGKRTKEREGEEGASRAAWNAHCSRRHSARTSC